MGSKAIKHIKRIQEILAATAAPLEMLIQTSATFAERQKLIGKLIKEAKADEAEAKLDEAKAAISTAEGELESLRTELEARIKHFGKFIADSGEQWTDNKKSLPDAQRFLINMKAYSRAIRGVTKHADAVEE